MWLNLFRNMEDPRVQENRMKVDMDNKARPEAWQAIGLGKSMFDVIRDCEKAVGRGVYKEVGEAVVEEPMGEDLVISEVKPESETTEEDGPLPDFLNLKRVSKTCQIKPDTLETIRKKEKAIAEEDDTAEAVRAYWGGDVTGGMTVTGKEVDLPEPYDNEPAKEEEPEVLDDKYKGRLDKMLEGIDDLLEKAVGSVEKGVWQRRDGSWWQTNPEGGKPIPYKAPKEGQPETSSDQGLVARANQMKAKSGEGFALGSTRRAAAQAVYGTPTTVIPSDEVNKLKEGDEIIVSTGVMVAGSGSAIAYPAVFGGIKPKTGYATIHTAIQPQGVSIYPSQGVWAWGSDATPVELFKAEKPATTPNTEQVEEFKTRADTLMTKEGKRYATGDTTEEAATKVYEKPVVKADLGGLKPGDEFIVTSGGGFAKAAAPAIFGGFDPKTGEVTAYVGFETSRETAEPKTIKLFQQEGKWAWNWGPTAKENLVFVEPFKTAEEKPEKKDPLGNYPRKPLETFPLDRETGKPLMRAGFHVNPIQPMTQAEVDRQHDLVSAVLNRQKKREKRLADSPTTGKAPESESSEGGVTEKNAKMFSALGFEKKDWPMIQEKLNTFPVSEEAAKKGQALASEKARKGFKPWTASEEIELDLLKKPPLASNKLSATLEEIVNLAKRTRDPLRASRLGNAAEDRNWHIEAQILRNRAGQLLEGSQKG